MSTPPLRDQEGQNEIRYVNVLPLFPITPNSAEVARRYGRVSHVFSGLISMFVFDIVQIHGGCCPLTYTFLATGLRPRFPSIVLWTIDTEFVTTDSATFLLRKSTMQSNQTSSSTDGPEYLGRYCWKTSYMAVLCLCV
jgi:hypothetical protein